MTGPEIAVAPIEADSGLRAPTDSRTHFLLVLVERGPGTHVIGQDQFAVSDGEIYVVRPNERYDALGLRRARGYTLRFGLDAFGTPPSAAVALPAVSWTLLSDHVRRVNMEHAGLERWRTHLIAVKEELAGRSPGWLDAARAHITLALVDVARLAERRADERIDPLLADVFAFIDSNFASAFSVRDVAAAVARSPGHLTRVVRDQTGKSVVHWIQQRRMDEARRLLLTTDLKIEAVARRSGYEDAGYFRRRFREAHGAPPQAWRFANRV